MDIDAVPAALRERLGPDASRGLSEMFDAEYQRRRGDLVTACIDRFDRRLVEETAALRIQLAGVAASLRQEMAQLRQEMGQMEVRLRQEMGHVESRLGQQMATGRVEIFKWCFLFWIGQIVTMSAIIGAMLRLIR